MQITTSAGKQIDVLWCWGPLRDADEVMLCLMDDRPISEIAADFDGLEQIVRTDEIEKEMTFTGYSRLRMISRERGKSKVTIALEKGESE